MSQNERQAEIFKIIGDFGKWQLRVCLLCTILNIFSGFYTLTGPFYAPPTTLTLIDDNNQPIHNLTHAEACNTLRGNGTKHKYKLQSDIGSSTIIKEWTLVCENAWLASFSQSAFLAGMMVSGPIVGKLSDKHGRKIVAVITSVLEIGFSLWSALARSIEVFILTRFLLAFACFGRNLTTFLLATESVGPKYRGIVGVLFQLGYATGHLVLPIIAYYVRDFRILLLVTTLPEVLLLLLLLKAEESPSWSIAQKNYQRLRSTLVKALKVNGRSHDMPKTTFDSLTMGSSIISGAIPSLGYRKLLISKGQILVTMVLCFLWFISSFTYYGLTLNMGALGGNLFLSIFLGGLLEFPAYIVAAFVLKRLNGPMVISITQLLTALSFFGMALFKYTGTSGVTVWCALTGKLVITICYSVLIPHTSEAYPTAFRQTALGFCSLVGRTAGVLAPFMNDMMETVGPDVVFFTCGTSAVFAALMVLIVPSKNPVNKE